MSDESVIVKNQGTIFLAGQLSVLHLYLIHTCQQLSIAPQIHTYHQMRIEQGYTVPVNINFYGIFEMGKGNSISRNPASFTTETFKSIL